MTAKNNLKHQLHKCLSYQQSNSPTNNTQYSLLNQMQQQQCLSHNVNYKQFLKVLSIAHGINLQILVQDCNILKNILKNEINRIFLNQEKYRSKIMRLLGLMAYCHPVMLRDIQLVLENINIECVQQTNYSDSYNLQTLNVFCLIPTFNIKLLTIKKTPTFSKNSYEQALWFNSLNTITQSKHYKQVRQKTQKVDLINCTTVRNFINDLFNIRQFVFSVIYKEQLCRLQSQKEKVKFQHKFSKQVQHSDTQLQDSQKYTSIELYLSYHNFITVDYLPPNFIKQIIQIWIDRTVQINSLMGNFVCKERLGQFQYLKGPLLYAIKKGIVLVLNNFQQISNDLLVSIRTLAIQHQIIHNQKVIKCSSGFKIIGICSSGIKSKWKSAISNDQIPHIYLPMRKVQDILPEIQNETNLQFILTTLKKCEKLGIQCQIKLWKRIQRLRKSIVILQGSESLLEKTNKLWSSYFTQSFKDQVNLQINQLQNSVDYTRQIQFQKDYKQLKVGRCSIHMPTPPKTQIVPTQYSLGILERLIICNELNESPLLISETGCGKTTLVQYLAQIAQKKLYIYNMSSGTDVTDLVGGFKPIDCRAMLKQHFYLFIQKFLTIEGAAKNQAYVNNLISYFQSNKLQVLLKSLVQSIPKIIVQISQDKKFQVFQWQQLLIKFQNIQANLDRIDSNLVFSFIQGNLIKAIKNGDWILIDQINLATNDVLQKIIPLIQGKSLLLYQKGDLTYIQRNSQFKVIACMNPATDSGKKPLPQNLYQKFTPIHLSEPSRNDIQLMVKSLCPQLNPCDIADIYFQIKKIKTVSLRNLSRSLSYINKNKDIYGMQRAIYDGLVLGYGQKNILLKYKNQLVPRQIIGYKLIQGFLLQQGPQMNQNIQIFHLTQTFLQHLKDFLRAISGTQLPVLLQGPTSAGKTSMIRYVAQLANHKCIRINNHQHTQIQQYIGNYFPDKQGKLVFREGPLVTAVKQGYWLILDQLNLAKTEILQCLNRLLDDNRQLFIPEQQKHIKPHKNFRIFATQNPSSYSGRKTLSRAFRNRFISLSFMDITVTDTMAILQARRPLLSHSKQLSSYVRKVLESLINYRQRQKVFSKDGLITMRDLLKWTGRHFIDKQMFIIQGYGILAQRLRTAQEKQHVLKVLTQGTKINLPSIYSYYQKIVEQNLNQQNIKNSKIYVQMNKSFKRMSALTYLGVQNNQAILLVGETGCGKTTLAQLLSFLLNRPFYSINCHKHTQASDLLGSLRPAADINSKSRFQFVNGVVIQAMINGGILLIDQINTAQDSVLQRLNQVLQSNTIGVERGQGWEVIKAKQGFCIIATMNPSGDYGKKQLSPALRNRFTQIWVQPITHPELIVDAKQDIIEMVYKKLSQKIQTNPKQKISQLIYQFIKHYNCQIANKYNLSRKRLTMRDIGWICSFINSYLQNFANSKQTQEQSCINAYFWSLRILAIEGINFMMSQNHQTVMLDRMKSQLLQYIKYQTNIQTHDANNQLGIIEVLKQMNFPLMIKTDLPLELLGLEPQVNIFFSAHTDLTDLLGQYQPEGNSFVWHDQNLLKKIKNGGTTALVDLNLAQQQVIEGINSLFDHRGSIFVVQLNETIYKHQQFKPIVVLKHSVAGNQRKGLPNSFLNRFVKLCIQNVSTQLKLKFITKKYPNLHLRIYEVVKKLLEQNKKVPIQKIQFICQVCSKCIIELNKSLEIVNIFPKDYQPFTLFKKSQYSQVNNSHEQNFLDLLPLIKQFDIRSQYDIQTFQKLNVIYSQSRFSVCMVGKAFKRDKMVNGIATIYRKRVVKIILSTMTDMNDLLGSYQQISEEDQMIEEQQSIENTLQACYCKESNFDQAKKTKFVYLQSSIIKSLKDDNVLVYIEVPNEILLQRVQKGLIDIYSQNKQIIVGIDTIKQENDQNNSYSKFITINLSQNQKNNFVLSNRDIQKRIQIFTQNMSNLNGQNKFLRKNQLINYIQKRINQNQTSYESIRTLNIILNDVNQGTLNKFQSFQNLQENVKKIKEKKLKQLQFKLVVNQSKSLIHRTIKRITYQNISFNDFKCSMMIKSFMSSDQKQLHKRGSLYGRNQQNLIKTIKKFQTLYLCNINNFQQTSLKVLEIIFKNFNQSQNLLSKFAGQIDRLHDQLFRDKIKHITFNYNDEDTKIIPIINNIQTIKHMMIQDANLSVKLLSDETTKTSVLLRGVQKEVVQMIQTMKIDVKQTVQWIYALRLKQFSQYQLLENKLKIKKSLLPQNFTQQIDLLIKNLPSQFQHMLNFPLNVKIQKLLQIFSPSQNIIEDISIHIKDQIQLQCLKELVKQDENYLKHYTQICQLKYLGYKPKKWTLIHNQLSSYQKDIQTLAKTIIYRGHDNKKSLMQFYKYFGSLNEKLILSNYSAHVIKNVILQSYEMYYDNFNDILVPFYIPLLAIFIQKEKILHQQCLVANILSKKTSSILQLAEEMIEKESQQVDRAKDYINFQKKFNRTVIVDEYTQEGLDKNKANIQEQFNQLFGKNQNANKGHFTSLDKIHMHLNKQNQDYYNQLSKTLSINTTNFNSLIVSTAFATANPIQNINIYQHRNSDIVKQLIKPLPKIMNQVYNLISQYKIDSLKTLSSLLGKIYEHKAHTDQVYKVLVDCEYIIEKSLELNSILPSIQHIPLDELIAQCLYVRRLQLKNWKSMLIYKQQRTQKMDLINFIQFYKLLKVIKNEKQAFVICQNYLRQSSVCCLPNRMNLLDLVGRQIVTEQKLQFAIFRVIGFYEYLMPHVTQMFMKCYNQKVAEMKEYQTLAGWNSNQYLIFKSTCQKFQRKIHHILRKFDDELSMPVGTLHQSIKEKQIFNSIQQFNSNIKQQQLNEKQIMSQQIQAQNIQMKDQKQANEFEEVIKQIFSCLNDLQETYHNSQSKLRIIRDSLNELQDFLSAKKPNQHYNPTFLTQQMFQTSQKFQKCTKYYYGMWDKLCQRMETAWNRDIVDRLWLAAQNIWTIVNSMLPESQIKMPQNGIVQDIKILFKPYFVQHKQQLNKLQDHSIFQQQIEMARRFLQRQFEKQDQMQAKHKKNLRIDNQICNIMKLGYIVSCICINLQKNGLCVKQQQEGQNQSGTQQEQIGGGMGIGQGEAHEAARNVGDQIQFQQQVQGHKDQQQNPNNNAGKNQQNDIQMQGEFDGQMFDKEQNQNENQEDQSKQGDEQMGQVQNQNREQEMKNQQGEAEDGSQADVDVKGQKQGEQQLIDNQREQKDQRKGQQRQKNQIQEDEQEQQQRSDWEDNQDQGEKINKQKQNVEEHQRQSNQEQNINQSFDQESKDSKQQGQEMSQSDQNLEQQIEDQAAEEISQKQSGEQNEQIQIENSQQPIQQQEKPQQQKKEAKNKKQYNPAYGRQDNKFAPNNNIKNDPNQVNNQIGDGQNDQQGNQNQGQKRTGKSIHTLTPQFLQEIMKKQRSTNKQDFMKNLNVNINEQENQDQVEGKNQPDQQYALTEQNKNISTNLPMMMDLQDNINEQDKQNEEDKKNEEEKKKQKQQRNQQNEKQKKGKKKEQVIKDQLKNKDKDQQKNNTGSQDKKGNNLKKQQNKTQTKQEQYIKKQEFTHNKNTYIIDENQETLIKEALMIIKNQENSQIMNFKGNPHIIAESYLLSKILEEQLKSVLQPLDQAEYKGDYKTGKKLNLKKIIPFIASNYRKDRIWLRRTQPSDRNYYVMLALDDTKSMHYGNVGEHALKGLLAIGLALQHLNIKTSICSIRDNMQITKKFNEPLNCEKMLQSFSFQYESSNSHDLSMSSFMSSSLKQFERVQKEDSNSESRQLCIIISDGKMNKQMVKPFIKQSIKKGITYVFIIVDSNKGSILNIKTVEYVNGKMQIKSYMNDFPYDYFLIINQVKELGDVLGSTLMQFIQSK